MSETSGHYHTGECCDCGEHSERLCPSCGACDRPECGPPCGCPQFPADQCQECSDPPPCPLHGYDSPVVGGHGCTCSEDAPPAPTWRADAYRIPPAELSFGLRCEAERQIRLDGADAARAYRVPAPEGWASAGTIECLYLPYLRRIGIAAGADPVWVDGDDVREAIEDHTGAAGGEFHDDTKEPGR